AGVCTARGVLPEILGQGAAAPGVGWHGLAPGGFPVGGRPGSRRPAPQAVPGRQADRPEPGSPMNARLPCHLQLDPAVRLRLEAWGGVAFDRSSGDLLELDAEGFAVLKLLRTPHTLPALQRSLPHLGRAGRPELLDFLRSLERRGFVRRVA